MPLIEFICYNPKQCKAGFSQAPAACLPIKIPSRTANPPSRLDKKQPVSKKRQAKSPSARADPPLPIPLPQGRWPAGLHVPSRVPPGEISVLQGDPKSPAQSRPTVCEATSAASGQGQAEPRAAHRRFPVGFSIPVGVAGSGPVVGTVTPPAKLGIPKLATLLPSPTPSRLGHKSPCRDGASCCRGHAGPGGAAAPWGRRRQRAGGGTGVHGAEQAGMPGMILPQPVLRGARAAQEPGAGMGEPGWGRGSWSCSTRSPSSRETLGALGWGKSSSAPGPNRHRAGLH